MSARTLPKLILASGSPRRRLLLGELGLTFETRAVDVDESRLPDEPVEEMVLRLALAKADADARPGELVLAADTIVALDRQVLLGKPADRAEAAIMLESLSGREHEVLTGVALVEARLDRRCSGLERTRVRLGSLDQATIRWYVETGEPLDKAGAYAIQGLGALFVEAIEGNYTNVVGLPLPLLYRLFEELDYDLLRFRTDADQ